MADKDEDGRPATGMDAIDWDTRLAMAGFSLPQIDALRDLFQVDKKPRPKK